jgi:hypothetical protein
VSSGERRVSNCSRLGHPEGGVEGGGWRVHFNALLDRVCFLCVFFDRHDRSHPVLDPTNSYILA